MWENHALKKINGACKHALLKAVLNHSNWYLVVMCVIPWPQCSYEHISSHCSGPQTSSLMRDSLPLPTLLLQKCNSSYLCTEWLVGAYLTTQALGIHNCFYYYYFIFLFFLRGWWPRMDLPRIHIGHPRGRPTFLNCSALSWLVGLFSFWTTLQTLKKCQISFQHRLEEEFDIFS